MDLERVFTRMKRANRWWIGLVFPGVLLALLAACGGTPDTSSQADTTTNSANAVGDPVVGEQLFHQTQQFVPNAPPCETCHVITAGADPVVGPNLHNIANVAGTRVPGQSAEEYLRLSIVAPNDYIVEGYQPGIMARTYDTLLTEAQINDLVAYMLTLE